MPEERYNKHRNHPPTPPQTPTQPTPTQRKLASIPYYQSPSDAQQQQPLHLKTRHGVRHSRHRRHRHRRRSRQMTYICGAHYSPATDHSHNNEECEGFHPKTQTIHIQSFFVFFFSYFADGILSIQYINHFNFTTYIINLDAYNGVHRDCYRFSFRIILLWDMYW